MPAFQDEVGVEHRRWPMPAVATQWAAEPEWRYQFRRHIENALWWVRYWLARGLIEVALWTNGNISPKARWELRYSFKVSWRQR
jgi:hypothetical protein